jgi:hypothetical protein
VQGVDGQHLAVGADQDQAPRNSLGQAIAIRLNLIKSPDDYKQDDRESSMGPGSYCSRHSSTVYGAIHQSGT